MPGRCSRIHSVGSVARVPRRAGTTASRQPVRKHWWVVMSCVVVASACYTSVPMSTMTPTAGAKVIFVINDAGRVGLGERIGPGVERIEGRVVRTEGDSYVVNVFSTTTLAGTKSVWSGEEMRFDRGF